MSENPKSPGISKLIRDAVALWVKCLPQVVLILIICTPPAAWAYGAIQRAGTDVIKMILLLLFFQAFLVIGSACVISVMEAKRSGKKEWLERALTRSLRLFGWDLLVGFQTLIRAFLLFFHLLPDVRRNTSLKKAVPHSGWIVCPSARAFFTEFRRWDCAASWPCYPREGCRIAWEFAGAGICTSHS